MRELTLSKHLRLKIQCLILVVYTLYNGTGLVYIISTYGKAMDTQGKRFARPWLVMFVISSLLQMCAIFVWWVFAFRLILYYHYRLNDLKWLGDCRKLGYAANTLWGLGLFFFAMVFLVTGVYWYFPPWIMACTLVVANKSLPIALTMSITYELDGTMTRKIRFRHWMNVLVIYCCVYIVICFIVLPLVLWFAILVLIAFFSICCVSVSYTGCCYGSLYCECYHCPWCCVSLSGKVKSMGFGATLYLLFAYFFLNDNQCLAWASALEFVIGSRGACLLVIFYVVLVSIDMIYASELDPAEVRKAKTNTRFDTDDENPAISVPTTSDSGGVLLSTAGVETQGTSQGAEPETVDDDDIR